MAIKERHQVIKWVHPPSRCYKVNVDSAMFSKRKQARVGVVIRDGAGQVIIALSKKLYTPLGALE